MTEFVLDLSNYKDRVGARVDEGRYRVIVDDVEMDKSKAGNPMVNVWLRILDGDFKDATITDRLTITEKSMFRIVGFMQGIGLQTPKKRLKVNLAAWVGKVLEVDVEDGDPYNGRVKSEVRGYIRITKSAAESSDLDDLATDEEADEEEYATEEYDEPEAAEEEQAEDEEAEEAEEAEAVEPTPIKKAPAKKVAAKKVAPAPVEEVEDAEEVDLDTLDLG